MQVKNSHRMVFVLLHLIAWIVIFFAPQLVFVREFIITDPGRHILPILFGPLSLAMVFYTNFLWTAPRLLDHKGIKRFICLNLLMYALCTISITAWHHYFIDTDGNSSALLLTLVTLRDIILYMFVTALAVIIHMSIRFYNAEKAREEIELKHAEAELVSLRNQVSPHFLLNTLNNIYALVAFNQEKAQQAIEELSKLLSHMLYENVNHYTTLDEEVKFLYNYVELMKLRMSDNVEVQFSSNLNGGDKMPIASLLFISLVENAFKHGTGTCNSRIMISITANPEMGIIEANFRNTNNPKSSTDKSGHGVGLHVVQRRLDLLYKGQYTWEKGIDTTTNEYFSKLKIQTK